MDFIEVSAKTYEDAVTDALIQLGLTSDQLKLKFWRKEAQDF